MNQRKGILVFRYPATKLGSHIKKKKNLKKQINSEIQIEKTELETEYPREEYIDAKKQHTFRGQS